MGSGKTACMVREMVLNEDLKKTYSNIIMKDSKINAVQISRDMIFTTKTFTKGKKEEEKLVFNEDYWKQVSEDNKGINVVIDEAHTLINSRRAMSTENMIMNDFMALLRRILGDSNGYGELILITQLVRRIDVIARELATSIHYHVCHYRKECKCGYSYWENNEKYGDTNKCPYCNRQMKRVQFIIEKWEFDSMDSFGLWEDHRLKMYKKHYFVTDIEEYFDFYDTHQWSNLISEY